MIIAIEQAENLRTDNGCNRITPVSQTMYGSEGNCIEACIATILGLGIYDVPVLYPHNTEDVEALNRWLASRGVIMLNVCFMPREIPFFFRLDADIRYMPNSPFILMGSTEYETRHSVV